MGQQLPSQPSTQPTALKAEPALSDGLIMEAVKSFELQRPKYVQFAKKLDDLLVEMLRQERVAHYAVEHRVKEIASFREKCVRPGKHYSDPFVEIQDKAGLRIILYYVDDVERVCKFLDKHFLVVDTVDKRSTLDDDQFGYLSVHKIIRINGERSKLFDWKEFVHLEVEIQVRTMLQHAWAAISHTMQYKREADAPRQLRRALNRIAGLFELADEQFLSLRIANERVEKEIKEQVASRAEGIPINVVSVSEFLQSSDVFRSTLDVARNMGVKKIRPAVSVSDLVAIAGGAGFRALGQLEKHLENNRWTIERFFKELENQPLSDRGILSSILIASSPDLPEGLLVGLKFKAGYDKVLKRLWKSASG
jgi:putative GTP pyrophosphokinase